MNKTAMLGLILLFFTTTTFAQNKNPIYLKNSQEQFIITSYEESSQYFIDVYQVPNGQFQSRIEHLRFSNLKNRNSKLYQIKEKYKKKGKIQAHFKSFPTNKLVNEGTIWNSKNDWDSNWEALYQKWIEENVDRYFFSTYGIKTDCADVLYGLRWIFSRIHSLSVASTLAGSGQLFTNNHLRKKWHNLPTHRLWHKDQRFLAALEYIMANTYTGTLSQDTFSLALKREVIQAGTIYMPYSGHAGFISGTNLPEAWIKILQSTVPRYERELYVDYSVYGQPNDKKAGFRQFKWYDPSTNKQIPAEEMPNYSLQQYSPDLLAAHQTFSEFLFSLISTSNIKELTKTTFKSLENAISARVEVVKQGHGFCLNQPCLPGSTNWENWSTPSRDRRLNNLFQKSQGYFEKLSERDQEEIKKLFFNKNIYLEGLNLEIPTYAIYKLIQSSRLSSDPNESIALRWGISGELKEGLFHETKNSNLKKTMYFKKYHSQGTLKLRVQGNIDVFKTEVSISIDQKKPVYLYGAFDEEITLYGSHFFLNIKSYSQDENSQVEVLSSSFQPDE